MRAAVYAGTKNLYQDMVTAAKSLLIHSNVQKIYFLIEDDVFPYDIPNKIECINVKQQSWFPKTGINYKSTWGYMVLLRAAYSKIFYWLDTILSLDIDTIINEDISQLWDLPLEPYYFAAVKEPEKSSGNFIYTNFGVALLNLKKIREDRKDDEIIQDLNHNFRPFCEQDSFNILCQSNIFSLPADYNISNYTDTQHATRRKIIHYARVKNWQKLPLVTKYKNGFISRTQDFGLDVIIPAYNDAIGLQRTLKSIYYPELQWLSITVVNDCSSESYGYIEQLFPKVKFINLTQNHGPGYAKQYGIEHTGQKYFTFVDCGDIILSKYSLLEIKDNIQNNSIPYFYLYTWINGEWNTVSGNNSTCTPAWIYKREFFSLYDITFCTDVVGSYSNQDIGFNHTCLAILQHINQYDKTPHKIFYDIPIYKMIYDKNSLTHKSGNYILTKQIPGLSINATYCIRQLQKNHIDLPVILQRINIFMFSLYETFLTCAKKDKTLLVNHWKSIREFYLNTYAKYMNYQDNKIYVTMYTSKYIKQLLKLIDRPNIYRFFSELNDNENCPDYYLTLS